LSTSLRGARQTLNILGFTLLACLTVGCVTGELRSMEAAQAEYEACVAEFSAEDPDCRALHVSLLEAQRRYENNSRRAWSCDPMSEDCPTRR